MVLFWNIKGYWYFIKEGVYCTNPNKFKSLIVKSKIIIEDVPHYRYIADLWELPKSIKKQCNHNYIIDIIEHFSKCYGGYILETKEESEVLSKIDIY